RRGRAGDGRGGEGGRLAGAEAAAAGGRGRWRERVDDDGRRSRGGGAAVDRDGHRVCAGVGRGGIRARRVLLRRGEAVRPRPRVGRAGHGGREEGDRRAGAERAAVRRGRRCGSRIDRHDRRRRRRGGAVVRRGGDGVAAGGGGGVGGRGRAGDPAAVEIPLVAA